MNEKIKINYNQKHRFFKFIILWLITFAFMFSCSMIIYAVTVNVSQAVAKAIKDKLQELGEWK